MAEQLLISSKKKRKRNQEEEEEESSSGSVGSCIQKSKLGSSDRAFIMVMDEKHVEGLITNYYRILNGTSLTPSGTMRSLKKTFTKPYKCKRLRENLSYIHTLYAGRDEGYTAILYQKFKKKYENCYFWDTFLLLMEHPDFMRFKAKPNSSRSGAGTGSSSGSRNFIDLSAGPSSFNFARDSNHSCKIVFAILQRLNVENNLCHRAMYEFRKEDLREFFVLLESDDERRLILGHEVVALLLLFTVYCCI